MQSARWKTKRTGSALGMAAPLLFQLATILEALTVLLNLKEEEEEFTSSSHIRLIR